MQQQVRRAERVVDLERQRRALRQTELERIERDAQEGLLRPRTFAAVALGECTELTLQALPRIGSGACEQIANALRRHGVSRRGRVRDERTVIREPVAIHVAADDRRVRIARSHIAEPVHPHRVKEVVAERVLELMARIERGPRPFNVTRIGHGALEPAVLLTHVAIYI